VGVADDDRGASEGSSAERAECNLSRLDGVVVKRHGYLDPSLDNPHRLGCLLQRPARVGLRIRRSSCGHQQAAGEQARETSSGNCSLDGRGVHDSPFGT
jgi:hypothetical protein